MRLNVTDIPPGFPVGAVNGQTLSVFTRVMNLAFDAESGSREIVTIDARAGAPASPGTARLGAPDGLDLSRMVRPGARLAMRGGILRIHDTSLALDFRDAAVIRSSETTPVAERNPGALEAGWIDAWTLFLKQPDPSGFAAALFPDGRNSAYERALAWRVRNLVPDLLRAAAAENFPLAWDALRRLLGCGPGLTPAGDDFATGLFLGLQARASNARRQAFLADLIGATLAQASDSTNISRVYFEHAAAGRFSAPMRALAEGISTHAADLDVRLDGLLAMGHSSGRDATFGLFCGLSADEPDLRMRIVAKLETPDPYETFAQ